MNYKRKNKRGEAVLTTIIVIIIIIIVIAWLVNIGGRECRRDSQCKNGQYCGADFACHDIPVVEKTVYDINLLPSAIVLGIALVAAAFIFKWKGKRGELMVEQRGAP